MIIYLMTFGAGVAVGAVMMRVAVWATLEPAIQAALLRAEVAETHVRVLLLDRQAK